MKISVVMCTYNGEKYIEEQLCTIRKQSRKPDEVILCDDRSTDKTAEIIRNFIRTCGLEERWHLYENAENVGWKRNFMEALRHSTGDLIFLADQDDLWHPRKIELMSKACEQHPEIGLLVCDCYPFDDATGERKKWFLPQLAKQDLMQVPIGRSFAESLRPGCTYALRSSMREYINEMWEEDWPHDLFFWCTALAQGSLYSYPKVLVKWRRSEGNATPRNDKTRECRLEVLDRQERVTQKLLEHKAELKIAETNADCMEGALQTYRKRKAAIEHGSVAELIALLKYLPSYPRKRSWIGDVVAAIK